MKETNFNCLYSYVGLGHIRCSYAGNEGCICKEKCEFFEYQEVELD